MDVLKRLYHFVCNSFLRYSLATELYMVEPWERITIHVLYVTVFVFFWYFNYSIILNGVSRLRDTTHNVQSL